MRALVCRRHGNPEVLRLEDVPAPAAPAPGWVTVEVHSSAANFADALLIAGTYQTRPPFPYGPGLECAGVVTAVGRGCTRLRVGDTVMGLADHSAFAEQVSMRESDAAPLPPGMPAAEGAGFPLAYLSSHVALRWVAGLQAGETVLVLGASGGVGGAAVDVVRALGGSVIAAAGSPAKLEVARRRGAAEGVDYSQEDLAARVLELTDGGGVDVIFDPVGGAVSEAALSGLGWGGRLLLIGFVAGVPSLPANRLLVKHRSAMSSALRYFRFRRPDLLASSWEELTAWYGAGVLRPAVWAHYPLHDGAAAIMALTERRALGKAVVQVRDHASTPVQSP